MIGSLAALLATHDLSEIEIGKGDLNIRLARQRDVQQNYTLMPAPVQAPLHYAASPQPAPAAASPASAAAPAAPPKITADHKGAVTSPMVGTIYLRPNPEAKPFIEIGTVVKAGERVLLVEAMKTFNEIAAPVSGTVTQILVKDGQPVEFGEVLLVIE